MTLDPRFEQHRRIAPGSCPGGVVARLVDAEGTLRSERLLHCADAGAEAAAAGEDQAHLATELLEQGADSVWAYLYDGDSGECLGTVLDTPAHLLAVLTGPA